MHELTDVIAADEVSAKLLRFAESVEDGFVTQSESTYVLPLLLDKSRFYSEELNLNMALTEGQGLAFLRAEVEAQLLDEDGDPDGSPVPLANISIQTNDKLSVSNELYLVEEMFDMSDEGFYLLRVRREPTAGGGM